MWYLHLPSHHVPICRYFSYVSLSIPLWLYSSARKHANCLNHTSMYTFIVSDKWCTYVANSKLTVDVVCHPLILRTFPIMPRPPIVQSSLVLIGFNRRFMTFQYLYGWHTSHYVKNGKFRFTLCKTESFVNCTYHLGFPISSRGLWQCVHLGTYPWLATSLKVLWEEFLSYM